MVCRGINHFADINIFAFLPNGSVAEVYNGSACIITFFGFAAITKQTRAGYCICIYPFYNIVAGNIDDILKIPHVAVIDVQHRFQRPTGIIDCTTVEIYCDVKLVCTKIGVDIDDFASGIKRAVIESHLGRAVCPDGVISRWAVECGISECCSLIAPVESLAVDHAVFNDCVIGSSKTEIIFTCSLKRHVLKCYSFLLFCRTANVETVVAVIFRAEIIRVRYLRTDAPLGFFRPRTNEGQVFTLGVSLAGNTVQCVVAFTQLDGIATVCSSHSHL